MACKCEASLKTFAKDKRASLFCHIISYEEFLYNIDTRPVTRPGTLMHSGCKGNKGGLLVAAVTKEGGADRDTFRETETKRDRVKLRKAGR